MNAALEEPFDPARPMRVGIVTEYYRPWPGGISEHVHHESLELRRRGHEVAILTGPGAGGGEEGARVIRLPHEVRFASNGSLSRMSFGVEMLRLRRLFGSLRLDLVHVHAPLDPLLGLAAVLSSDVATVGTFHASFRPSPLWDALYGWLRPLTGAAFQRLDARVAVSEEARHSIAHYFPARYDVVPNGVDLQRFDPSPLERETHPPTILFVGRPDPRKGLPLLLEAFAQVRRTLPDARLVVVGAGEPAVWSRLMATTDAQTRAGIHLAGYASPGAIAERYARCDVFCSPAVGQESQGIVLLEAMAAGRPSVAFDIPGYREVVTSGEQGLLVTVGDVDALADALTRLLLEPAMRRAMGEAGRQAAERYAWPDVAARIEQVFFDALRAHRGRRARQR